MSKSEGYEMKKFEKLALLSAFLGVVSLAGMVLAHLALTDIWHAAEADLSMEWSIVRMSFLLQGSFLLVASLALALAWKRLRRCAAN